jgi:hypothetical protein
MTPSDETHQPPARWGAGPPPPRSGFSEVSPERVPAPDRAKADGAKPLGE